MGASAGSKGIMKMITICLARGEAGRKLSEVKFSLVVVLGYTLYVRR